MAQIIQVHHRGLYTSPNELSAVPDGALLTADNCVITVDQIIEPRRGQDRVATAPVITDRFQRFEWFQGVQLGTWTDGKVGYNVANTWTALSGTYEDVDADLARRRFLTAQNNAYLTTSTGIFTLDAYNSTPYRAGMPRGLDIQAVLPSAGSGFFSPDNQIAYRVVWGRTDANNTPVLGAPSGRVIVINASGGSADEVNVNFPVPQGATTSWSYYIYRSKLSGSDDVTPDDELGLVYQSNPTSGELVAGIITVRDKTPDSLRGATLYTSASQFTIAQANDQPPVAWDIEEFQNCICFGNVFSKHRLTLTLLSAAGLSVNDTVTVAGFAYTVKASEDVVAHEFQKFTSGTPAQNIQDTAFSLIRCINQDSRAQTVYAYYLSGPNDLPGQILVEERDIGGAAFTVVSSAHGTAWNPALPTSGTLVSSLNDDFKNGIMFSRQGIGEAVPRANIKRVGSANNRILRIKKLRSSLFIFKEVEGIFRMTGTGPDTFDVDLFDSSARLIAPDTVEVVNNQIWCLTDQGLTTVTETGVSVISRPIENLILDQFAQALTQVQTLSFGVGYETDRQYQLWTVGSSADTCATQGFVFNIFTQSYTRWPMNMGTGKVSPVDGKLYFGDGLTSNMLQERKNRNYTDYVDYGIDATVVASAGVFVTLDSTENCVAGDVLYQSASAQSLIREVVDAFVVEVADDMEWVAGAATIYKGYRCTVEYAAVTGGNPGTLKQFPEISLLFRSARFDRATVSFSTDASTYWDDVPITGDRTGLWGLFGWGTGSKWGGTDTTLPIRTFVPLEKQRGTLMRVKFSVQNGYSYFRLNGWSMPARDFESFKTSIA